jgi:hypothetical protein
VWSRVSAATVVWLLATTSVAGAAEVLSVGPGKAYAKPCQAIAAAHVGDTIQVDAAGNGSYDGDVCTWSTSGLTIEGVNGRPHIAAAGQNSDGKAIWVISGSNTTIRNVELSGAVVADMNGAGIRLEGPGLTVIGSYFHDNQDGILTNANAASDVLVDSSEFADNGADDGYSHNIYVGRVRSFTLRYSYSHDAKGGQLVKSRADVNDILYNRLTGEGGASGIELDLPNGGASRVIGNSIEQGPNTTRPILLGYGLEGASNPNSRLAVVNNTLVSDLGHGTAIAVAPSVSAPVLVQNDISIGSTTLVSQPSAKLTGNCTAAHPGFLSRSTYDYRLTAASACLTSGVRPAATLVPTEQYTVTLGHSARADEGLAAGAFSLEAVPLAALTSRTVLLMTVAVTRALGSVARSCTDRC